MPRAVRRIALALAVLAGALALAAGGAYAVARVRMSRTYRVKAADLPLSANPDVLERGRHVVEIAMCRACHGRDLGGALFIDDPAVGVLPAPNLTPGQGGVGAGYDGAADWVRTLRHGIAPDGRPLIGMPSQNYRHLGAEDLAAMISYLRRVPPVHREQPERRFTFAAHVLFALGAFGELPAEVLDHDAPPPAAPAPAVTAAYGRYLLSVSTCRDCHGENLRGARGRPDLPFAPDLTAAGPTSGWSFGEFLTTVRTGVTPSGRRLDPATMPWPDFHVLSDDELRAMWLHLRAIGPPQARAAGAPEAAE